MTMKIKREPGDAFRRLARLRERVAPQSKALTAALARAGNWLVTDSKRLAPIDQGFLRRSIKYDVNGGSLEFGSYGVPYAAFQEFGFAGRQDVSQHTRNQTVAFGRRLNPPRRVTVRAHSRVARYAGANFGLGYLRPSIVNNADRIQKLIVRTLGGSE